MSDRVYINNSASPARAEWVNNELSGLVHRFAMGEIRSVVSVSAWADGGEPGGSYHMHPALGKRRTNCHVPVPHEEAIRFARRLIANSYSFVEHVTPMTQRRSRIVYDSSSMAGYGGTFEVSVNTLKTDLWVSHERVERFGRPILEKFGAV